MQTKVYNTAGKPIGEIKLSDAIFARPWNPDLVYQVVVSGQANRRRAIANTKTRAEVSGGGKKPWRQKGTGRARHGSIRSPLWIGGGVTHGPRSERDYAKKVNKKMAKAALYSAISKKLVDGEVKVVDTLALSAPKTKELTAILKAFSGNALLVPSADNKNIVRAVRNVPKAESWRADALNAEIVLKHKNVLIDKAAISEIK